jgi:hypothetical protein
MQNSRCPICRRQAEKFINIKVEGIQTLVDDEEMAVSNP